jgi:hypothetical protein
MARRCWSCAREKNCSPCWARTTSDRDDPPGTQSRRHPRLDEQAVPVVRRTRRTLYYRPTKATPAVDSIRRTHQGNDQGEPSFGYRTVAHLLDFNKNAVQRIFQLKGWQVKKRPIGFRPRVQVLPSVAHAPNAGRRTCARSGPVATSGPRWRWSSTAIPRTAGMAPAAFGQGEDGGGSAGAGAHRALWDIGPVATPFLLGTDNGLVFTVAATRHWCAATASARNSSPRTRRSRTAWWNASSEP